MIAADLPTGFGPRMQAGGLLIALATAVLFAVYGANASADLLLATLTIAPVVPLVLLAAAYPSARAWLFSAGFWLTVTIVFYIVLKAWAMIIDGDGATLVAPLAATLVFAIGYVIAGRPVSRPPARPRYRLTDSGVIVCALLFVVFALLGVVLVRLSGAGNTVLDVSNATQNGGAGYLYRIPLVANGFYLLLLDRAYRARRFVALAMVCTAVALAVAVVGGSRFQIIIVTLWNLYFYNRYIRPLSIVWLMVLSPPLVFVIVLFGYVRNIGIGDAGVLIDALRYFRDHSEAVFDLFMARLDMLPHMAKAFALAANGEAPRLNGMSYVYALLHAIPRNVWPDKPPLTAALLTAITDPGPFRDGVLFYPSVIVEALFNLGWTGIFLVGLAVGALGRGYDRILAGGAPVAATWALLSFTFPMGLFNEGFHSNYVANVLYVTALYAGAFALLRLTRSLVR